MTTKTKTCSKCHETKTLNEFNNDKNRKDGKYPQCKMCKKESDRKYRQEHREEARKYNKKYKREHKKEASIRNKKYYEKTGRQQRGHASMYENKLCPAYLGVVIGERLCRHLFKDVEVMPHGNTGFDIICNKGKKIDVKTGCITLANKKYPRWAFAINRNVIADYFILVAFDNLTDLNPLHLWMIPGKEINDQGGISIRISTIHKWNLWERNVEEVQLCCAELKK